MDDKIPEGLEDLLKGIIEDDEKIPEGLDDLLDSVREDSNSSGGGALATIPKKPDDLVDEEIDSQILSILGLEDVFDLTYEEYASLLKEAAIKGRMADSQMTTESIELITNELKRVKGKTGKFKVKPKKVDINKVLNRKPGAIVKVDNLKSEDKESEKSEEKSDSGELKKEVNDGINKILESLITIKTILEKQKTIEKNTSKSERRSQEKYEKDKREKSLEKRKNKKPEKSPKINAKPVGGFFDMIKRFFTNIILGSVVMKIFNWMNDPKNKESFEKFKSFMIDNAPLILGVLTAIALSPLIGTLLAFTGPILSIAIPALKAAFAFFSSPLGLVSLAGAIASYAGEATRGLGDSIRGDGSSWWKNILGGSADTLSGATEVVGAPFRAIIEYAKSGGDIKKSNQVMASIDANIRESFRKGLNSIDVFNVVSDEKGGFGVFRFYDEASKESAVKAIEEGSRKTVQPNQTTESSSAPDSNTPASTESSPSTQPPSPPSTSSDSPTKDSPPSPTPTVKRNKRGRVISKPSTTVQPQTPKVPGGSTGEDSPDPEAQVGDYKVIPRSHPETGSGYGIEGINDEKGRPAVFSKKAAEGFAKMIRDSNGAVKGSDIASSMRSPAKNKAVGGATNSRHMTGTAMDIHGSSNAWIRKNGSKYGWTAHDYPGSHGGHFIFAGAGLVQKQETPPAQIATTPAQSPTISSPTGRSGIGILPMPMGGKTNGSISGSGAGQTKLPYFSSEDPNNMTTMVVKGIYNVVG